MKQLVWALMAMATFALAQEKAAPPKPTGPQKSIIVDVKNGDVERIAVVVAGLGANVRADSVLRVIAVGGDAATVTAVEEAIKRLDVPPTPARDVELTMYLVYGAAQENPSAAVPQDLDATVKQLRAIFPYKSYKVLDTIVLRARDGQKAESSGSLPGSTTTYSMQYYKATITGQAPRILHIDQLQLRLGPPSGSYTSISTNVDAREGQKTVVGKANIANTEDAVFLVITPKVVE